MDGWALFDGMSTAARWWIVAGSFVAAVVCAVAFLRLNRNMRRTGGPSYDRFQRLPSAAAQTSALADWGSNGLRTARRAWALDLVFPLAYGVWLATLASLAASHADGRAWDEAAAGLRVVSWLAVAAAATDLLVENAAVGRALLLGPSDRAAQIASWSGKVERVLIVMVALVLLVALVALAAYRAS